MRKYYYYENYCEECGEPISDRFTYCYQHAFDKCKCGNMKKRNQDYCKECHEMYLEKEKRLKFGYAKCPICGDEFSFSGYLNEIFDCKYDNTLQTFTSIILESKLPLYFKQIW